MPSLRQVKSPNRTVQVPFEDVTVTVTYDPNFITPRLEEDIQSTVKAGGSQAKSFLAMLCKWLVDWDLTEEDSDVKLKISVDTFLDLPEMITSKIVKACMEDLRPNQTSS